MVQERRWFLVTYAPAVTEAVYRQQIRPVMEEGATVMDRISLITDEDASSWQQV
jgi:hypothetical protein